MAVDQGSFYLWSSIMWFVIMHIYTPGELNNKVMQT